MSDTYILDINKNPVPCETVEAFKWKTENPALARVGSDNVGKYWISTVFLVLDHGWHGDSKLFETCIFTSHDNEVVERYSTWDEAHAGHNRWIEKAKEVVSKNVPLLNGEKK